MNLNYTPCDEFLRASHAETHLLLNSYIHNKPFEKEATNKLSLLRSPICRFAPTYFDFTNFQISDWRGNTQKAYTAPRRNQNYIFKTLEEL